ncbi:MAG: hypothetical protein Q9163_003121 [Psora crenata]
MMSKTRPRRCLRIPSSPFGHNRAIHTRPHVFGPATHTRQRPRLPLIYPTQPGGTLVRPRARTIFIQTENTPNTDALKFLPNHRILPKDLSSQFIEYLSPRSTLAAPHPSPLASRLLNIDGITSVFYGPDFITVTKASDTTWAHLKPEVFSLITEAVASGEQIVNTLDNQSTDNGQTTGGRDTLVYDENDIEVVGMIKELLETRIRPSIQEDGGDIEFRGFQNGIVLLKLRGACRTCDSSTVTLKNGIENMLMHYVSALSLDVPGLLANGAEQIDEVKGVTQVLDQEEEIAMQEFAKFEEKLKEKKSS